MSPQAHGAAPLATLAELAALLGPSAQLHGAARAAETTVLRVHTDTRTLQPGDCFVALRGERFDAHDFLPQAAAQGAVAVIAERGLDASGLPGLQVADSLMALQALSAAWRARFTLPVIAVTGSNGKTTVTQMVAAILRAAWGDAAWATRGNLNNHIGVPLTLLGLRPQHRAAVVELGMNHPGEIAALAGWAQPTVALVNNAQREHQEFMGTVEAVAAENGAVLAALPDDGVAVFPADDAHSATWEALAGARRRMRFGGGAAEVQGDARWAGDHWAVDARTPAGTLSFEVHLAGRHNVRNALAAVAATLAAGLSLDAIARGLSGFRAVAGRSQLAPFSWHGHPVALVDDSYNANPDSVRAAIDVLAELPGPRWLLLGDMGEVGDQGPAFHAEVGAYAAARGIDHLWTAGPLATHAAQAYGPGARLHPDTAALVAALETQPLPVAGSVLVKGSRFMTMERALKALQARGAATSARPTAASAVLGGEG